ncbi:stress-responsive transcriptional regulator PspC [Alkalibacter rhizosphaerae]|uniref:Stress-responsive transcriptional regulator PspC n=1 Tax=Alkalibacter rhizosphaerae TaxID=2815577 RepID=A0A974XGV5_9FIRM|nr:stress-responsive transcriptional regulator PspC [Alkalibacter rhizosphaerae]QSX08475.1 stress-responsive transcriptional regulator PspC [Alkalibacter rhizosphaerae]
MKKWIGILSIIASSTLMVMGLLYLIQKKQNEKIGGRLIKVDYRFSKEF